MGASNDLRDAVWTDKISPTNWTQWFKSQLYAIPLYNVSKVQWLFPNNNYEKHFENESRQFLSRKFQSMSFSFSHGMKDQSRRKKDFHLVLKS